MTRSFRFTLALLSFLLLNTGAGLFAFVQPVSAANVCCACRERAAVGAAQKHKCWFIQQADNCSAIPTPTDEGSSFWTAAITGVRPGRTAIQNSDCFQTQTAVSNVCTTGDNTSWYTELCEDRGIMQAFTGRNPDGSLATVITRGAEPPVAVSSTPQGLISETSPEFRSLTPRLSVPIPGLTFTDATMNGQSVVVPFLAEYIVAIYKFAIASAGLLASIMVVYGGFRYLLGSTLGDIKTGKEVIQNALIGLVVLLCSYIILNSLNPDLVQLRPFGLDYQSRELLDPASIQAELGTTGDNGGASATCLNGSGRYWSRMQSVCQTQEAFLAMNDVQKLVYLRQIVDVWKRIGIDEHGGIYVRGGNQSCSTINYDNVHQPSNGNNIAHVMFKMRAVIPISALGLTPDCAQKIAVNTDGSDDGEACYRQYWAAYNANYLPRFRQAGLYCGDCIANVRNIYQCYGGRPARATVGAINDHACSEANPPFNFTNPNTPDDQIRAGIARLHFGDWIADGANGHAYMYTGKAGLPYEIMEMGTTGSGGDHQSNRIAHGAPINYTLAGFVGASQGGGMAIYRDAFTYIKEKVHSINQANGGRGHECVTAVRGMPAIPDAAYETLRTTPLQPFAIPSVAPTINESDPNRCTVAAAPAAGGASAGGTSPAGGTTTAPPPPVTADGITVAKFNYTPSTVGWRPNESWIMFPERLVREVASAGSGNHPRLRVYMYIHGGPPGAEKPPEESAYYLRLRAALLTVASQKNIIIIAPHYFGHTGREIDFMNHLDIGQFYNLATQRIAQVIPGATTGDILDTVIGGHSEANCKNGVLSQAVSSPLPRQRGIVLYDGCLGGDVSYSHVDGTTGPDVVNITTYPATGAYGSLYFNPDVSTRPPPDDHSGMGASQHRAANINTIWGLTPRDCPASITSVTPAAVCTARTVGSREIFSIKTSYGHGSSVLPMTKTMFNVFYNADH